MGLLNRVVERFRKDMVHYIILMIGVLFCLYILLTVKSYEVECNNYWVAQINDSDCLRTCFAGSYKPYEEGIQFPGLTGEIEWGYDEASN